MATSNISFKIAGIDDGSICIRDLMDRTEVLDTDEYLPHVAAVEHPAVPLEMLRTISVRIAALLDLEFDDAEAMHAAVALAGSTRWTEQIGRVFRPAVAAAVQRLASSLPAGRPVLRAAVLDSPEIATAVGHAVCGMLHAASEVMWDAALDYGRMPSAPTAATIARMTKVPTAGLDGADADVLRASRTILVTGKLIDSLGQISASGFDVSGTQTCPGADLDVLRTFIAHAGRSAVDELLSMSREHLTEAVENYVLRTRADAERPTLMLPGVTRIDIPIESLARHTWDVLRLERPKTRDERIEQVGALARIVVARRKVLVGAWRNTHVLNNNREDRGDTAPRSYMSAVAAAASVTYWWTIDDASIACRPIGPAPSPDRTVFGDVLARMPEILAARACRSKAKPPCRARLVI
jgi:hypothetical protein